MTARYKPSAWSWPYTARQSKTTSRTEAPAPNSGAGFTLIELLITVAIAGVLVAIAYPGYQQHVLKVRRSDGITAILAVQMAQERFRANCPFYAGVLGNNNVCGSDSGTSTVKAGMRSPDGYYELGIVAGSATAASYTVMAMPAGTQVKDTTCKLLTLTFDAGHPNGLKTPPECW